MPIVTMPDGTNVEMPDNPTPEQLAQLSKVHADFAAKNKNAPPAPAPAPAPEQGGGFLGMLKQAGAGLAEGATGLTNMMGRAAEYAFLPSIAAKNVSLGENLHNQLPAPKGDGEKYVRSISDGVGGALATGPAGAARKAIIGAMSGLGAEVGERTIGGVGGRVVGGLAGGGLSALPGVFAGNTQSLARRALKDVKDEDVIDAIVNMRNAKDMGIPLTFGQAMGKPSNVDALEGALANSEVGRNVQTILRTQPVATANATRGAISALPGEIVPAAEAAAISQKGATQAIASAKKTLSDKVGAITPTKGNMTQNEVNDMRGMVESMATPFPVGTATGDRLRELSAALIDKATGKPIQNIEQLDNVFKDIASGVKSPALGAKPMDAHGQGLMSKALSDLRAMVGARFPNYAKSKELYAEGKDTIINPLKEGVIGQIAKRQGFQEGNTTVGDVAKAVFMKGTNPDARTSDILTMERELTKAGQGEAFTTPAKTYLADILAKAVTLESDGAAAGTANAIKTSMQGDVMQKTGLRDILVGMARAQKLPDNSIYPGFERVLEAVTKAAKRPQRVMGMNEGEIAGDSSRNALSNALRVFSFMPVEKVAGNVERVYSQSAMRALDKMVTSPEGVKELQRIARIPAGSKESEAAIATLLATYASKEPE